MKRWSIIFIILANLSLHAQFDAVEYDFTANANVLQTNPGASYPYQKLIGIPLLNNIKFFAGNSGFTLYDVLSPEGSFEQKVQKTVSQLSDTDFVLLHYRHDLFSYGWTDDLERFKYLGLYWELNHITYTPASFLKLGLYGNAPYMNKTFEINNLASKTELVQTLYFGININPSPYLHLGGRIKLYSGLANAQSVHNTGKFYTSNGQNNFYVHHLDNVNVQLQSSGYHDNADTNYYMNKIFFSGNYGPGIDLGLTYKLNKNVTWTAALLDLGFIYYTKDINSYYITGSYQYEGVNLQFPEQSYMDYWENVKDTFKEKIKSSEDDDNYISWRPTQFYTTFKFGLKNKNTQDCKNFLNPVTNSTSFVGLTGFAQYQPVKIHLGISAFYEQEWSKHFYTKFNITADNFSYYALGGGLVLNLEHLQLSLIADNLLGLSDLAKSRKQAIQFGLNFVK